MVYIPITRAQSDLYNSTYTKIFKLTKKIDESKTHEFPRIQRISLKNQHKRVCQKKLTAVMAANRHLFENLQRGDVIIDDENS